MPKTEDKRVIRKVALAEFKDKKILLGRDNKNEEVFIMIGGKVEDGETDIDCLNREVKEEIGIEVDRDSIKFLQEFIGPAHGKGDDVELHIRVYEAKLVGEPRTSEEIVELSYFDTNSDPKHFSEIGKTQIMPWLKAQDYIN